MFHFLFPIVSAFYPHLLLLLFMSILFSWSTLLNNFIISILSPHVVHSYSFLFLFLSTLLWYFTLCLSLKGLISHNNKLINYSRICFTISLHITLISFNYSFTFLNISITSFILSNSVWKFPNAYSFFYLYFMISLFFIFLPRSHLFLSSLSLFAMLSFLSCFCLSFSLSLFLFSFACSSFFYLTPFCLNLFFHSS